MTKWKKDETEFTVGINYNSERGTQAYIPKPILEFLGEPENLKFMIRGKTVVVTNG